MARKGSFYPEDEKVANYFAQGFRLGLFFGALGALVMLGRGELKPKTATTALTTQSGSTTAATEPVVLRAQEPRVVVEHVTVAEKEEPAELPAGTSIPAPGVAIPQTEGASTVVRPQG